MDTLFKSKSKVTIPIKPNYFEQSTGPLNIYSDPFKDIPDIIIGVSDKNETKQTCSTNRCCELNQKAPKQQIVEDVKQLVNEVAVDSNDIIPKTVAPDLNTITEVAIDENTLLKIFKYLEDPAFTLLRTEDQVISLKEYKDNLVKDLTNEKNFWKGLGFSRKRTLNLDKFKEVFCASNTDGVLLTEHIIYLCKHSEMNIIILENSNRTDYLDENIKTPPIYIAFMDNKYRTLDVVKTEQDVIRYYMNIRPEIKNMKWDGLKIADLKMYGKLFGIKASTKAEIIDEINKISFV